MTGNTSGKDQGRLEQQLEEQMALARAATNPAIRDAFLKQADDIRAQLAGAMSGGTTATLERPSGRQQTDAELARGFAAGRLQEEQQTTLDRDIRGLAADKQWARIADRLNGEGIRFGEQDHIMLTRQESGMIRVTFTPKRHLGAVTVDVLPSTALKLYNYLEAESGKMNAILAMIARQMEIGGGDIGTQEVQLRQFIKDKTGRDQ